MRGSHVHAGLLLAGSLLLLPLSAMAQKQVVTPPGSRPSATLSPAIRVGNLLFLSGQLGAPAAGDTTIQAQTKVALDRMKVVMDAAGAKVENVVKCTVFLVNTADFGGMNQAYQAFFTKDPPARSTVVVAALVSANSKVEIECIAAMP
jgi:2-iminobutanoate/2-iminopropanoate deaminase